MFLFRNHSQFIKKLSRKSRPFQNNIDQDTILKINNLKQAHTKIINILERKILRQIRNVWESKLFWNPTSVSGSKIQNTKTRCFENSSRPIKRLFEYLISQ